MAQGKKTLTKDDICKWLLSTYWEEIPSEFENERRFKRGKGRATVGRDFSCYESNLSGHCNFEDIDIRLVSGLGEVMYCGNFSVQGW